MTALTPSLGASPVVPASDGLPSMAAKLLDFWFGNPVVADAAAAGARVPLWFGKRSEDDKQIRSEFGHLLPAARADSLADWSQTSRGILALVIVRDQISRVLYRDSAAAFACDDANLALVRAAVREGAHHALAPIEKVFFYMPYMHSEIAAIQEESIVLYGELVKSCHAPLRPFVEQVFGFAQRHHDVVMRFGRFPHRNTSVNRPSTEEEVLFLLQPGSSF